MWLVACYTLLSPVCFIEFAVGSFVSFLVLFELNIKFCFFGFINIILYLFINAIASHCIVFSSLYHYFEHILPGRTVTFSSSCSNVFKVLDISAAYGAMLFNLCLIIYESVHHHDVLGIIDVLVFSFPFVLYVLLVVSSVVLIICIFIFNPYS